MYRLRHRFHRHHIRYLVFASIGVLVIGGGTLLLRSLQPDTILTQSPAVTHHITATTQPSQHITKSFLTFDLPAGWIVTAPPDVAYTIYSWRGGTNTDDVARRLDIYVDTMPATLAVNRLLPVMASGDHFDITGVVSDNCVTFTDRMPDTAATGRALSKWDGVNFWCDMANYQRDVVAIGSTDGINTTTLTGVTAGSHQLLLIYTDNSASPDYSIFTAITKSLSII